MSEQKLEPCPFCGDRGIPQVKGGVVWCLQCATRGGTYDRDEDAATAWNLRAERPGWREGWEVARAAASEVAEGLRREYAGWAKNFPEEDRESDLAKALVCQTIALAIRALHPSVAEGRGCEKI